MTGKKKIFMIIAGVAAVGIIGFADTPRQPENTRTDKDVVRTETQVQAQAVLGEKVAPRLDPELARIEAEYRARMDALENELTNAATDDQREAIQQRAAELKVQWTLALADRQIELARQTKDAEAETEALHARQVIQNPPPVAKQAIPRDPNAGIVIEGGAK